MKYFVLYLCCNTVEEDDNEDNIDGAPPPK